MVQPQWTFQLPLHTPVLGLQRQVAIEKLRAKPRMGLHCHGHCWRGAGRARLARPVHGDAAVARGYDAAQQRLVQHRVMRHHEHLRAQAAGAGAIGLVAGAGSLTISTV